MPKQDVNVKSYVRRGKLVKQYNRKQDKRDRKKVISRVGIIAAAIGLPIATYAAIKFRYVNNLNSFAKQLKPNQQLGEVVKGNSMTFTMGGFVGVGGTKKAAERLSDALQKQTKGNHSFIPIDHVYTPDYKYKHLEGTKRKTYEFMGESAKQLGKTLVKGKNKEAENIAEVIYSYVAKNPNKPVNIVGHSGGGVLAREVDYILRRKGVNPKLITMASPDFQIIPRSKNELNFVTDTDFVKPISAPNSIIFTPKPGQDSHRQPAYLENESVMKQVNKFLFS